MKNFCAGIFGGIFVGAYLGFMAAGLLTTREYPSIGIKFDDTNKAIVARDQKKLNAAEIEAQSLGAVRHFLNGGNIHQTVTIHVAERPKQDTLASSNVAPTLTK